MATEPQDEQPRASAGGAEIGRKNIDHQIDELRAEVSSLKHANERDAAQKQLEALQEIRPTAHALSQLEERGSSLQARDPALAERIDRLAQTFDAQPTTAVRDVRFKTDLAYALQDAEKITGRIAVHDDLRQELAPLAASSPGLKNQHLKELLELTPTIDNPDLVARLREKAKEIAGKSTQNTKAIQEDITALAIEVSKSPRHERPISPDAQAPTERPASASAEPPQSSDPDHEPRSAAAAAAEQIKAFERGAPNLAAENSRAPSSLTAAAPTDNPSSKTPESSNSSHQTAAPSARAAEGSPAQRPAADPIEQIKAFERGAPNQATDNPRAPASHTAAAPADDPSSKTPESSNSRQQPGATSAHATEGSPTRPATSPSGSLPKTPPPIEAVAETSPAPHNAAPSDQNTKQPAQPDQQPIVTSVNNPAIKISGAALGKLLSAVTPRPDQTQAQPAQPQSVQPQPAQSQNQPPSIKQRLATFEQTRIEPRRANDALLAADRAARAAIDALGALRHTTGAEVLNRIEDAGANAKGGLKEVLSELKPGGKFQDLGKQLKNALNEDGAFVAAYDHAEKALEKYGDARVAAAEKLPSSPNATRWADHLKTLDAEIAKAGSAIPDKEGKDSILEKLGEKARQIVDAAVEKVQRLFQRPDSSPSPSPQ